MGTSMSFRVPHPPLPYHVVVGDRVPYSTHLAGEHPAREHYEHAVKAKEADPRIIDKDGTDITEWVLDPSARWSFDGVPKPITTEGPSSTDFQPSANDPVTCPECDSDQLDGLRCMECDYVIPGPEHDDIPY